jgi:putative nucleotidyltransferase with HDIG domain
MDLSEVAVGDVPLVTLTFLFTDIEGSTALWEEETDSMRVALQRHNALLSSAVARYGGWVFKTVGDAFCVSFDSAPHALETAREIQQLLSAEQWPTRTPLRVRAALHTGPAYLSAGDYFGKAVNRCARLLAVARGGQTLLSSSTEALVRENLSPDMSLHDLGMLRLRDLAQPVHAFQLIHAGLPASLLDLGDAITRRRQSDRPTASPKPSELFDIPALPAIVMRVQQALNDPNGEASAVQEVVVNEPAISAKLLRVANSAFFDSSERVGTVAEAVRRLVFANVQGMLLGAGAYALFRTKELDLKVFWRHSIATALAARMLAPKVGCPPEEAFTAGLLHDIGKLVFAVQEEIGYQRSLDLEREANLTGLEAERAMFEFTHPEVGQTVAERWNLTGTYVNAIAHHHEPCSAEDDRTFCALIGLADEAAHAAFPGISSGPIREANRKGLQEVLGLSETDWEECVAHLAQAHCAVDAFLGAL